MPFKDGTGFPAPLQGQVGASIVVGNDLANRSILVEEHDLDRHLAHDRLVVQGYGVNALRAIDQLKMKVWNLSSWYSPTVRSQGRLRIPLTLILD